MLPHVQPTEARSSVESCWRREVEAAALVGRGVDHLLLLRQVAELGALALAADAAALVGQPTSKRYQLNSHITVIATTLGRSGSGRTDTAGGPSDRATPPTVRTWSEPLKTSRARSILSSAFVGTARTWRGSRGGSGGADSGERD